MAWTDDFTLEITLGYEILKWEGDLAQPTVFLPLAEPVLREKIAKLHEHYGSQRDRSWFDAETFGGLLRAGAALAEFECARERLRQCVLTLIAL